MVFNISKHNRVPRVSAITIVIAILALIAAYFAQDYYFSLSEYDGLVVVTTIEDELLYDEQHSNDLIDTAAFGDEKDVVEQVQEQLAGDINIKAAVPVTGYFDTKTKKAIEILQADANIEVTGAVDSETLRLINERYLTRLCPSDPVGVYPNVLHAFVGKEQPLPVAYAPRDLVTIPENIYTTSGVKCLRKEVLWHFEKLVSAAEKEGLFLGVTSAYRSPTVQQQLYDYWISVQGKEALDKIAKSGYSEHQLGTTLDLTGKSINYAGVSPLFDTAPEYDWLKENAYKYGFALSYPRNSKHVTGYSYEPWHWRYVGLELASFLKENNQTFAQFIHSDSNTIPKLADSVSALSISADVVGTVYVQDNGSVYTLVSDQQQEAAPIASITKLMTAWILLEGGDPAEVVTVKGSDITGVGSNGGYKAGDSLTVGNLITSFLIESDNDAARMLARARGGVPAFVEQMNTEAARLGMKNTHFYNVTGLDVWEDGERVGNSSTPEDLALMVAHILRRRPEILETSRQQSAPIYNSDGSLHHVAKSTNTLLSDGLISLRALGGKTGETPLSRQNLMMATKPVVGGGALVHVILGSDDRFGDMRKLMNWVDESYRWIE